MNDTDGLFADAIDQLLSDVATPAAARAIEGGTTTDVVWEAIQSSGFCDALVDESRGGAGLELPDAYALFEACGRHAVPVPVAQTAVARAVLAAADIAAPGGPIAIAANAACAGQPLLVADGAVCDHVLAPGDGGMVLLACAGASRESVGSGPCDARLSWAGDASRGSVHVASAVDLQSLLAAVLAAQMAGAMQRVLAMSIHHANERSQFGRSIGKFQAVQHLLAVMAEQVEAATMAARLGVQGSGLQPPRLACAMAKARAGEAASVVAAHAHALHGAIGITAEFELQRYTRRLHAWRYMAGSTDHWHEVIGQSLLSSAHDSVLDFVREALPATSRP